MSSNHGFEIKKPVPRRLPFKTSDNQKHKTPVDSSDNDSPRFSSGDRELLTSSPIQDLLTSPKDFRKNLVSTPIRSASPESIASTTQIRWENIRQHVLLVPGQSTTPPIPQPPPPQQPTSAAASTSSFPRPPSRSQTPKPSRFAAKLGFRQVVDHVREVAVDENTKFTEEILKACWATRFIDPQTKIKNDRDATATGASSRQMQFRTNASSSTSNSTSTPNLSTKKSEQGQSSGTGGAIPSTVPSVRYLHGVLWQASGSLSATLRSVYLPHESLVLAALLTPFLGTEFSAPVEEERHLAVDAYDLLIKTWRPANELATAERCLWCTKAALLPPSPLRTRILSSLWNLTSPNENNHVLLSSDTIHSVSNGLFSLLPFIASQEQGGADVNYIKAMIMHISSGPVHEDALEEEYDTSWSENDSDDIRRLIISEALARCLQMCSQDTVLWLLQHALEEYWFQFKDTTPLKQAICASRLMYFCDAMRVLIAGKDSKQGFRPKLVNQIVQLLDRLIIPEAGSITNKRSTDTKVSVAKLVVEILCQEDFNNTTRWASSILIKWCTNDASVEWRRAFEEMLKLTATTAEWTVFVNRLSNIINHTPDSVRKPIVTFVFPHLTERLVQDPPPFPNNPLSTLLSTISRLFPPIFFKPVFSCAASNKEITVANYLCVLHALNMFVDNLWVRDAEMISVALMSDVGGSGDKDDGDEDMLWADVRLGQLVLLVELIQKLKEERRTKGTNSKSNDAASVILLKFAIGLETRLGILIETKERIAPLPPTQRMMLCILFREIRLLTRSLKTANWLPNTMKWFEAHFDGLEHEKTYDEEILNRTEELRNLYLLAQGNAGVTHKRKTFVMIPSQPTNSNPITLQDQETQKEQLQITDKLSQTLTFVGSLGEDFVRRALKLLVTVSSLLTSAEYRRIGPIMWYQVLRDEQWEGVMPLACFLIMQCAEKTELDFRAMIEIDMRSSDDITRLEAIRRINIIIHWRFQLMSQNVLIDRNHRPFKLARTPLPFVPTDMGSPNFVHNDNPVSKTKDAIPMELRKQLAVIGWADDDKLPDPKEEWIRTPVSLLPVNQVERLDQIRDMAVSQSNIVLPFNNTTSPRSPTLTTAIHQLNPVTPSTSANKLEETELLRRNSSSGGPTYAKRRPVFVPSLSPIFKMLAQLVYDSNYAVASAARSTLMEVMKSDPGLLLRPVLDLFCGDQKDLPEAINILTAILHTRHFLPPPMTHAIFNNLAGYLKYTARQTDAVGALQEYALTVPIMAQVATYVGNMTVKEIKKTKMEQFLIPYGTFWFDQQTGAPLGPMFPKGLAMGSRGVNPFEPLNPKLVAVTMIRISQNNLFVDMLKKNPHDVVLVRKSMPRFAIPMLDANFDLGGGGEGEGEGSRKLLELGDFIPNSKNGRFMENSDERALAVLKVLSLALSRSYVTLVAQMFRCMSRNSNDREEMAKFMDGLNRILLAHGDDIGIVGHVLIAYMVASARFRRLFISSGGYGLFMPALTRIYAESVERIDIKLAIEYAVYRFYALHREVFLFQSLDILAHIAALPDVDVKEYAARIYDLFYSLRTGVAPPDLDPAGIHNINRSQEKEALLFHAAEDKPQTFLTAIRRGEAQTNGQIFFEVPDHYENSRLRLEDFVKLFLTIIALDPSVTRAQHFMHLFRHLSPHLYHASTQARNTLQAGLDSLCNILLKPFSKAKTDNTSNRPIDSDITSTFSNDITDSSEKIKNTSNPNIMRMDFLFALTAMGEAGSFIPPAMFRQALEIAKLIIKEVPTEMGVPLSTFFADLSKLVILRGELSKPKYVIGFLQQLVPITRAQITTLDFTSVFETINAAVSLPIYNQDRAFAQIVVHELCSAGLEACETLGSETSNLRSWPVLVSLLAEAVFLQGADIMGELEKRRPTFYFLSKVVLPLSLTLKTSEQLASESGRSEISHQSHLTKSWIRLLFYAMTACQRSFRASDTLSLTRSKSQDKRNREGKQWQTHLPTFITALQIIKIIVVRAESEISTALSDLWHRLSAFLRSVLMDGNARFALHSSSFNDFSPLPSPTVSPRASGQMDRSGQFSSFFDLPGQSSSMGASLITPSARPRVIDYALWSTLEFLCAYRSPLRLQLHLFTIEKVVALDQELRIPQRRGGSGGGIGSPFTSPNTSMISRMSRRVSTSVFTKPRRSALYPSSPDSSPRMSRSPSMLHDLSIPSIHLGPGNINININNRPTSLEIPHSTSGGELRLPGYQYISPTTSAPSTPKQGGANSRVDRVGNGQGLAPIIVHLGPTSPSALNAPPLSPSGGGSMGVSNIRLMTQSTKIKSPQLIRDTYRRIRTVQMFMGYDTLLPVPALNGGGMGIAGLGSGAGTAPEAGNEEASIVTWTRRSALEAILGEMKQLEEEFEEILKNSGNGPGGSVEDENIFMETVPTIVN